MPKHFVYSARTTEKGLALLNKTKGDKSWDTFINEAVANFYNLPIDLIQLPPSKFLAEQKANHEAKEAEKAAKKAEREAKAKAKAEEKAKAAKAKADKAKADAKAKAKAKADADKAKKTAKAEVPQPTEQDNS